VEERHRHRWEFNNSYRQEFQNAGMAFFGHLAGWDAGGNFRIERSSIHGWQPIPSRVPFQTNAATSIIVGLIKAAKEKSEKVREMSNKL